MTKQKIFVLFLTVILTACGQKSTIRPSVPAKRLVDTYGDGKTIPRRLTFPITDSALAYKTPIPGLGPIIGGVVKFVGNVFAANTDMGKLQMSYTQAIPEIPEVLKSVKLTRVFFYMKPPKYQRKWNWLDEVILGKGSVTFDFLNKLAIRLNTINLRDPDNYVSTFITKDYNREESESIMEVFSKDYRPLVIDTEKAREINLIRYNESEKKKDSLSERYGRIHIMETSKPLQTIKALERNERMKGFFERILILDNSLLIELKNDPIIPEKFEAELAEMNDDLEKKYDVTFIDTCSEKSCIEFSLPDVNIVPILLKGNAIKLDGVIHADKVPETFSLKGFVEFEIRIESEI